MKYRGIKIKQIRSWDAVDGCSIRIFGIATAVFKNLNNNEQGMSSYYLKHSGRAVLFFVSHFLKAK